MNKILFPIAERDYSTTQGRLGYLVKDLARNLFVEFVTNSKEVFEDISKKLDKCRNLDVKFIEPSFLPLTFDYRDNLAKIFVQYTNDFYIPDTDLRLWKTAAFDDFWGHISTCSFPDINRIEADLILVPLMSHDDTPWEEADVFYTSFVLLAREIGIKVIGYQIYPVFSGVKLMPRLMDAIIVRKEYERNFHIKMGIPPEKVYLLKDDRDIYSISTIEDTYKNHIYNPQIEIGRDELGIVVCNHGKFRPQIIEIFKAMADTKIPIVLFLLKRDFVVREVKEDELIRDIYFDHIRKIGCRFYLVESSSLVPTIMLADIVISPSYIVPLEFSVRYDKKAWVYNPCNETIPDINGVTFINRSDHLSLLLEKTYKDKKKDSVRMEDILNQIINK